MVPRNRIVIRGRPTPASSAGRLNRSLSTRTMCRRTEATGPSICSIFLRRWTRSQASIIVIARWGREYTENALLRKQADALMTCDRNAAKLTCTVLVMGMLVLDSPVSAQCSVLISVNPNGDAGNGVTEGHPCPSRKLRTSCQ